MTDRSNVLERLNTVLDPEIGRSIVELGMVRDVGIDNGIVSVKIALTVAHCPLAKTLQADVEDAVKKLDGVRSVKVDTTTMTRRELEELKARLQSSVAQTASKRNEEKVGPGIERLGKRGIRSIIAIISGKGGVGKSFVTSALAAEFRRRGYEVGILDADLTGPSIAKVMGVTGKPVKASDGSIVPLRTKCGIKIMSINLVLDDPSMPVIWRGPIVNSVIRQLYWDVGWGDLHFLLVDLPPGTSDAPLTVFQSLPLDGVVVVSSPQDLSAMIVSKAVNMAKKMEVPVLGLVENMSYLSCPNCGETIHIFGDAKGETLANGLGLQFLGSIPLDPSISRLSDQGKIEEYSNPIVAKIVDTLRARAGEHGKHPLFELPIAWSLDPHS